MKIQTLETIFKLNKNQASYILRGDGWNGISLGTQSAHYTPNSWYRNVGFRLVQER